MGPALEGAFLVPTARIRVVKRLPRTTSFQSELVAEDYVYDWSRCNVAGSFQSAHRSTQ